MNPGEYPKAQRVWRRFVCALIGHDYTVFFRCLRCQPKEGDK